MADKFVFANFAVSTLQEPIGVDDSTLQINVDDVPRFPTLVGGAKFPLILTASDDLVEIVYVSALTMDGTATIERGMEGTEPLSWLAGTHLRHTFTAASLIAAAGIRPKGVWNVGVQYDAGDMVEHNGVSYAAIQPSLGQAPASGSAYWQVYYQPPGAATTAMNFQGIWSSSTTYAIGQVVTRKGRVWQANAINTNSAPDFGNANWTHLAVWSGMATFRGVLAFAGTNNYTATIAASEAPTVLYDGLTVQGRFANSNTTNATLTINALAAVPLRFKSGVELAPGDIQAGELYEFVYAEATSEFIAKTSPGATRLSLPVGVMMDWPTSVSVPAGWLLCYGQAVSRTTYAALFAKLGTVHGAGDGTLTFNLPDCRGRVSVGRDNMGGVGAGRVGSFLSSAVGASGGHQHLAAHNHTVTDPGHIHATVDPGHIHAGSADPNGGHSHTYQLFNDNGTVLFSGGGGQAQAAGDNTTASTSTVADHTHIITVASHTTGLTVSSHNTGLTVDSTGLGNAGNIQPSIVLDKIIFAGV